MNTTRNAEGLGPSRDRLFVTHCCKEKNPAGGDPPMLYLATRIACFCAKCDDARVPWAIVSAEHALFFKDEWHGWYDTALHFRQGHLYVCRQERCLPRPESDAHIERLVSAIRAKAKEVGVSRAVYYLGTSAGRAVAYLLVMHRALDGCSEEHRDAEDVLKCVARAGRLQLVSRMDDLTAAIAGREFHHSQVTALNGTQGVRRRHGSDGSASPTGGRRSDGFREALKGLLEEAERSGQSYVEVRAGDLHRRVGGYPGKSHDMPGCCNVMRAEMVPGDEVVYAPPSGNGARVRIRYRLPRGSRKEGE